MTRRGLVALLGVAGSWLAARLLGVPELETAAMTLLALVVAALTWVVFLPLRLEVHRTVHPVLLPAQATAVLELDLVNHGLLPSPSAWFEDRVPANLAAAPPVRLPVLLPGRRRQLRIELRGTQRGRHVLGPAVVVVRDPFGLAQRRRVLAGTRTVTVLPEVWALPPGVPLGGATGQLPAGPRRPTVHGEDIADIREYVEGDDLRSVHWPSTAHRGRLMVRQAEEATVPRASVLLDLRHDRHRGSGPHASIEVAIATAASVIHHLAARQRGVTLLTRPDRHPPPARPAAAWMPVLAALEPTEVDLPGLLRQVATGPAGQGTLVAVVTTPDATELRALVRAGRGAASRLAIVLDRETWRPAGTPDPRAIAAVTGLRAAGWRAARLGAGDRLELTWRELLGRARGTTTVAR
ncbi:MAG: DUF58 domain-containing protein [Nitriliruptoraceae bacterium]